LAGAFTADGKKLATMFLDTQKHVRDFDDELVERSFRLKIWDFDSGKQLLDVGRPALCAAFSPDGRELALGSWIGAEIICLDPRNGKEVRRFPSNVDALSYSADGRWLGCWHQGILLSRHKPILWGLQRSSVILWESGIASAFSPDSRRLLSGRLLSEYSGSASVWDTGNGRKLFTLKKPNQSIFASAFSRDGRQIVTYSRERKLKNQGQEEIVYVHSWDAETGKEVSSRKVSGHPGGYFALLSPDGEKIVTIAGVSSNSEWIGKGDSKEGSASVVIFDSATGQRLNLYSIAAARIKRTMYRSGLYPLRPMVFSPDSQRLAFYCADKIVDKIVIASNEKRIEILSGGWVDFLAFSGDGKLLAGLTENQIKVWDSHTGEQVRVLFVGSDANGVALIPDGSRVATMHQDGRVKLWDIATGQEVLTLKTKVSAFEARLLFSVDGEKLAVCWSGNGWGPGNSPIEIFSAPRTPALHKFFAGE
jgi:WD40 repeat protein